MAKADVIYLLTATEQADLLDIIEQRGLSASNWLAGFMRRPEEAREMMRLTKGGTGKDGAQEVVTVDSSALPTEGGDK